MFIIIFTFELCYCAVAACSVLRSIAGYVTEDRASRCGARTPVQSQCKPNAERGKLACMSYAEVKPDFAKQSKNTSIELYKIILNTYL